MFKNFAENIEEMVVDDVPIVKSRASRADYQTSQTTWKNRMEAQDTRWKERRDEIFEESIKSSCINKGALCSLCQNQYQMKLEKMMVERNITVENLDAILLSLKDRARQVRSEFAIK